MSTGLTSLDPATVERFLRDWERAFDDGDFRRMAAFYADDARLIGTHLDTVVGRPAIETFWRTACEGGRATGLRRTIELDEADSSGDLGYLRGTVSLARPGSAVPDRVRYVTLWRRAPDGVWRLTIDISSAAPPAGDTARGRQ